MDTDFNLDQQKTLGSKTIISQAFSWMFAGLIITGFSALITNSSTVLSQLLNSDIFFIGLIIAELALVIFLSARITKMSHGTAVISFIIYSILNGLTLSSIFLVYTGDSIASVFFITAIVFGIMAFYGYVTKKDLTTIGNLAIMALIGLVVASLVNLFLQNNTLGYILSYISILIFIALTAYDTQKLKNMSSSVENENFGVLGALMLYLDFINIFLDLLRLFGKTRER